MFLCGFVIGMLFGAFITVLSLVEFASRYKDKKDNTAKEKDDE